MSVQPQPKGGPAAPAVGQGVVAALQIDRRRDGGVVTVVCSGELEISTTAALRAELQAIAAGGTTRKVVLDLAGVSFLDSCGIGTIVAAHRALANDFCTLAIADPRPGILSVLEISGITAVIPVVSREPSG
jgi:anti-sigma B factor antagonist